MVTRMSNFEVLEGWLNYLSQVVGDLVGTDKRNIAEMVQRQVPLQKEHYYCLECPLQGSPAMGFSMLYNSKDFLSAPKYTAGAGFKFHRLFQIYAQLAGPHKEIMLELDHTRGNMAALYFDLRNLEAEQLIAKLLSFQAEARRIAAIKTILARAQRYDLETVGYGFVYAMFNAPLRLTFSNPLEVLLLPDRYDVYAHFVQELEMDKKSKTLQKAYAEGNVQLQQLLDEGPLMQDLLALSEFEFFECLLDIDVLPDGSLGETVGLQLVPVVKSIDKQHELLRSREFANFIFYLQKINVIDERIVCLADCMFYADIPQALGEVEHLFSMVSHFKLRYKGTQRLPARVYLQAHRGYED